ncbi:LysR family transcriptional regulator [Oceanisphaera psychrotolerans]|uniref:LysR family transcriptional regulator n=1 Tax=Oceanisphaera psychrotolerans TaxID=1414654 RepID=UPI0015876CF9|nr:LysR family transcriptional regulator [Oceanisphaera psychrotolerans]
MELIKTFLTVLDARGFKPAAEQLNKTPAAVSMQIKRLEEILGKRLLERSNQGISLTPAGALLQHKGKRLMALNYELLGDMRENELSGAVNFGAPADYAPTLLKKLLPIFQRDFPRVSPSILLEPSRSLRPRVHSGILDMAIVAREGENQAGHELWAEEVAWFGNAAQPDGRPRVAVLTTNCVLRDKALGDLKACGDNHALVLEAVTVASLRDAVAANFCQAFLPVSVAEGLERSGAFASALFHRLTFEFIAGPALESETAERVALQFRRAMAEQGATA